MAETPRDFFNPNEIVGKPYLFTRPDSKTSPFVVRFKLKSGKYIKRCFRTNAQRMQFIHEHRLGTEMTSFNAGEWQRWLYLKALCERYDTTPDAVIAQWESTGAGKLTKAPPLGELVAAYIASKADKSKEYRQHLDATLARNFVPVFGDDRNIASITRDELQKWLDTGNKHPMTYRNHRAYVRGLMHWAKDHGYLYDIPKTRAPNAKVETPDALTVNQAECLFAVNEHLPEACAALALGAFAGLRASSVARVSEGEIRLSEKQIFLPGEKFKTGRSHLIEGAPDNLWLWLERADLEGLCGWSERKHRRELTNAYERAGINPPKNALRHSFATYKCALDGSAEKASFILGHTNPGEIWQSYKGIATKADAERYFAIVPSMSKVKAKESNGLTDSDA